ncbi:hypothetical protein PAXINDRAFT_8593, partial [Paxillus involutus ATCC 200175]
MLQAEGAPLQGEKRKRGFWECAEGGRDLDGKGVNREPYLTTAFVLVRITSAFPSHRKQLERARRSLFGEEARDAKGRRIHCLVYTSTYECDILAIPDVYANFVADVMKQRGGPVDVKRRHIYMERTYRKDAAPGLFSNIVRALDPFRHSPAQSTFRPSHVYLVSVGGSDEHQVVSRSVDTTSGVSFQADAFSSPRLPGLSHRVYTSLWSVHRKFSIWSCRMCQLHPYNPTHPKLRLAGADIKEMKDKSFAEAYASNFLANWEVVSKLNKPVIAAASGYALGGCLELALQADILLAAPSAQLGQPEINLG